MIAVSVRERGIPANALTNPCFPDVVYFRFKVDRKIYVVGFGLYGSIHGQSEYETSIEVG